jgi:hypothetical protein
MLCLKMMDAASAICAAAGRRSTLALQEPQRELLTAATDVRGKQRIAADNHRSGRAFVASM